MLYTEDFSMRHYVGFSQIGSLILVGKTLTIQRAFVKIRQTFPPSKFALHGILCIPTYNDISILNLIVRCFNL